MIKFVIGPACAGKSTFIKNNFPEYKIVDLYSFQRKFLTINNIMESYYECKTALIEAIKENENVVLEHTLLKRKRRTMYIEAVKEITNEPIDIYVIKPTEEEMEIHYKMRKFNTTFATYKEELEMLEIPTKEDGFRNIYIVGNDGIPKLLEEE